MEKIDFKNKSVLDFGTGTGILSILAEKLGSNKITAIDVDEWSIENARENIRVNKCNKIDLIKSDTIGGLKTIDIILANINLNVIISNVEIFKKLSHKGTKLLLSGFLNADEKVLLQAFLASGFICNIVKQKEEWICIKFSL